MTSVEFVEKALIGSLLNESARRADVPWLRLEDFTNPLCRAIWRHLESGDPPRCQPPVDLVDLSDALGRHGDLHPRLCSPAELATLQVQAPANPAVAEYGRILVEATIRRKVAAMGLRLESLVTGEPEHIIDSVAEALASLEALNRNWQTAVGNGAQVDPDLREVNHPLDTQASSPATGSPTVSTSPAGDSIDQEMAEKAVIGAAVHDWPAKARSKVLRTVRSYDFTDARAAATWRAIEFLAELRAPIDEITVAWQSLRGRSPTGGGLTLQELRQTRDAAVFHEAGAITLARLTLARVAAQGNIAITRCVEDLGLNPATVIDSVATHHVALAATAKRLTSEPLPNESLASINSRLPDLKPRTDAQVPHYKRVIRTRPSPTSRS